MNQSSALNDLSIKEAKHIFLNSLSQQSEKEETFKKADLLKKQNVAKHDLFTLGVTVKEVKKISVFFDQLLTPPQLEQYMGEATFPFWQAIIEQLLNNQKVHFPNDTYSVFSKEKEFLQKFKNLMSPSLENSAPNCSSNAMAIQNIALLFEKFPTLPQLFQDILCDKGFLETEKERINPAKGQINSFDLNTNVVFGVPLVFNRILNVWEFIGYCRNASVHNQKSEMVKNGMKWINNGQIYIVSNNQSASFKQMEAKEKSEYSWFLTKAFETLSESELFEEDSAYINFFANSSPDMLLSVFENTLKPWEKMGKNQMLFHIFDFVGLFDQLLQTTRTRFPHCVPVLVNMLFKSVLKDIYKGSSEDEIERIYDMFSPVVPLLKTLKPEEWPSEIPNHLSPNAIEVIHSNVKIMDAISESFVTAGNVSKRKI